MSKRISEREEMRLKLLMVVFALRARARRIEWLSRILPARPSPKLRRLVNRFLAQHQEKE